jgi:hypothetical protein
MSAKMRGKKFMPSTQGSIVAAVDHAKSSAASRVRGRAFEEKACVAASASAGSRRPAAAASWVAV